MGSEARTHELKTWRPFWEAVADGRKRFEVRKNDRDYRTGDRLLLLETDSGAFTGRWQAVRVTFMLEDAAQFGVVPGYVVLGIEPEAAQSAAPTPAALVEDAEAWGNADCRPSRPRSTQAAVAVEPWRAFEELRQAAGPDTWGDDPVAAIARFRRGNGPE